MSVLHIGDHSRFSLTGSVGVFIHL